MQHYVPVFFIIYKINKQLKKERKGVPIMAHPPATSSDLTLELLLYVGVDGVPIMAHPPATSSGLTLQLLL